MKRDRVGFRFGFVRFLDVREPRSLDMKLDQIYIGEVKLFVNLPRFSKYDSGFMHEKYAIRKGATEGTSFVGARKVEGF